MPKINIYVPDPLHRKMCGVENVNWSAVAQQAFQCELTATKRSRYVSERGPLIDTCKRWLTALTAKGT